MTSFLFSRWGLLILIALGAVGALFGRDLLEHASETATLLVVGNRVVKSTDSEIASARERVLEGMFSQPSSIEVRDPRVSTGDANESVVTAELIGSERQPASPVLIVKLLDDNNRELRDLTLTPEQYERATDTSGKTFVRVRFSTRPGESQFTLGIAGSRDSK